MPATMEKPQTATAIRPFTIATPRRSSRSCAGASRRQDGPTGNPIASQGVQLATMQKLARYWATEYDWRKVEARLNALPQFITEIDGLDIHFIHVRSKHENALPLIVTHGWPGSVIEQLKIIDPLTDPTAHGGERIGRLPCRDSVDAGLRIFGQADDAPAGTQSASPVPGSTLMKRLGYTSATSRRAAIGARLSSDHDGAAGAARNCSAFTPTWPGAVPADMSKAVAPAARRRRSLGRGKPRVETLAGFFATGLAYALADGQPSADALRRLRIHRSDWPPGCSTTTCGVTRHHRAALFDGKPEGADARRCPRQHHALLADEHGDLLGAPLLGEQARRFFDPKGVTIPVAVSVFPDEIYQAPRSWAEQAYPKLIHYNQLDQGRALRSLGAAEAASWTSCARGSSRCGSSKAVRWMARARARHPPLACRTSVDSERPEKRIFKGENAMSLLVKTLAAVAVAPFSPPVLSPRARVVPIDNEPAPRLIVEPPLPGPLAQGVVFIPYRVENLRILPLGRAGRAQRVSARRASAHHRRRPALAVGGFRPEQHHRPGGHAARPAQGADRGGGCRRQRLHRHKR